MNVQPHLDGQAAARLLDHFSRMSRLGDLKPVARDRLEAAVGDELARRLVGALAGDHRLPARVL
ncbi:MAG TPA: hypothetical protein VHK46_08915 [Gaiellaceae bacterium]|nr:hypothetical protein [Gaiellaceae bacterium]